MCLYVCVWLLDIAHTITLTPQAPLHAGPRFPDSPVLTIFQFNSSMNYHTVDNCPLRIPILNSAVHTHTRAVHCADTQWQIYFADDVRATMIIRFIRSWLFWFGVGQWAFCFFVLCSFNSIYSLCMLHCPLLRKIASAWSVCTRIKNSFTIK